MRRRLLKPSWLLMHVLVAALCLVMLRLGIWQWGRGEVRGSIRNYSYGLEWWAFSVLTLVGWVKFCLDETAGGLAATLQPGRVPAGAGRSAVAAAAVDAADDPELAAWNARFAELARRDAEASS